MTESTGASKLRFALIGVGAIAQTHLQAFAKSDLATLAAAVDIRKDAVEAVAQAHHCQAYLSVDELLKHQRVDAAIVCTPPSTHPQICNQLASHGIHTLCEKPLAIDREGALSMIQAAEKHGTLLTMASKFRYVSDIIYAKQLITSGVLGKIVLFENTFAGYVDMAKRWNSQKALSGGGVLIDNGTHSIDIIRYLLGPLASVQTIEGTRVQAIDVEDTVRIYARTSGGTLAAVDLSWSINKQTPWFISIYGTEGTALVGWKESKYRRNTDLDWIVFGKGYDKVQAFSDQLSNFCRAIQGIEPLVISSEDGLASVESIEAAYQSMGRDGFVRVHNANGTVHESSDSDVVGRSA